MPIQTTHGEPVPKTERLYVARNKLTGLWFATGQNFTEANRNNATELDGPALAVVRATFAPRENIELFAARRVSNDEIAKDCDLEEDTQALLDRFLGDRHNMSENTAATLVCALHERILQLEMWVPRHV